MTALKLTGFAVDHADLLHRLDDAGGTQTITQIGVAMGRDQSNLTKTLKRLRDDGVVAEGALDLTEAGRAVTRLVGPDGALLVAGDDVLRYVSQLAPDPDNERKHVDPARIEQLMHSMLTKGQLQNLVIRARAHPTHCDLIVVGESRWRAARLGVERGLWPSAQPLRCRVVSEQDAKRLTFMRLAENLHRVDLHPIDEGAGYIRMRDQFGMDARQIAAEIDGRRSAKHIADYIRLVERLPEADKARMFLPDDDDRQLTYAEARRIVQGQNAKPRPAVDVDAKEALVLLEVADRCARSPSHDPLAHGREGWTRLTAPPGDSAAATSLAAKGLIEIRLTHVEAEPGPHAYVRVAPGKALDVRGWIAERGLGALWSARVAALDPGVAAALQQSGRYATSWLNDPIPAAPSPPREAPREPAPPANAAAQAASPPPPAEVGEEDRRAQRDETEGAQADDDELPPYLKRLAGNYTEPAERKAAAQAADPGPLPDLTETEAQVIRDIAAKIAAEPQVNAHFTGARVYEFWKDQAHQSLVQGALIKIIPDTTRKHQLACLTPRAEAWLAADASPAPTPPYATAWLNPPTPEEPRSASPPPQSGEGGPAEPVEGADAATIHLARPCVYLTEGLICGNCEQPFELSSEFDDQAGALDDLDHRYVSTEPGERCICPNCNAPLAIARVEVRMIDTREPRS